MDTTAPMLFARAHQRELMARAVIRAAPARGGGCSDPPRSRSSPRCGRWPALALDGTGVEVSLRVVGVPPQPAVVAWEEATAFGQPLVVAAAGARHRRRSSARIPGLWPPGPYALASAAARVAEAIAHGSRRRFSCFVALESGPARDAVVAMPVELGPRGDRARARAGADAPGADAARECARESEV